MSAEARYVPLSLPGGSSRVERHGFSRLCKLLSNTELVFDPAVDHDYWIASAELGNLYDQPALAAAARTVVDLVNQGWTVKMVKSGPLWLPRQRTSTAPRRRLVSAARSTSGVITNSGSPASGASSGAWSARISMGTS